MCAILLARKQDETTLPLEGGLFCVVSGRENGVRFPLFYFRSY